MSRAIAVLVAVVVLATGAGPAAAAAPTPAQRAAAKCGSQSFDVSERPAEHDVVTQTNLKVPMSDGIELVGDLHRPAGDGPWPTIVTTTPYSKNALGPEEYFPQRG